MRNVLSLLVALTLLTSARAHAVWLPGSCEPALLERLSVGQWVFVFTDDDLSMSLGRVTGVDGDHAVVRKEGTTATFAATEDSLGVPNLAQRRILEFTRGRPERRAARLVETINAGGGAARVHPENTSLVILDRAPAPGVLGSGGSPDLAFNAPAEIDAVIARINELGGLVLIMWPRAGQRGEVDVSSEVDSGAVSFDVYLSPRISRAQLAHEMIHVDDMIVDPLPEVIEYLRAAQVEPVTRRERRRLRGLSLRMIGVLETRAHLRGDRPVTRRGGWLGSDRYAMKRYYLLNRRTFHRGNYLLEPSLPHLLKWTASHERYLTVTYGPVVGVILAGYELAKVLW